MEIPTPATPAAEYNSAERIVEQHSPELAAFLNGLELDEEEEAVVFAMAHGYSQAAVQMMEAATDEYPLADPQRLAWLSNIAVHVYLRALAESKKATAN